MNNTLSYFSEKLKIWSGYVLFTYVATHLLNHAFGLFSLEVMEAARRVFVGFWRSPPLNYVVVTTLVVHALVAIAKTAKRKSFGGLSTKEWTQIGIGLFAPVMLIGHIMFTKVVHQVYGVDDTYGFYLLTGGYEVLFGGILTMIMLWTHGVIGLDGVLSTKPWYPAWRQRLTIPAFLLPSLAVAGAISATHQVVLRAQLDPGFTARVYERLLARGFSVAVWKDAVSDQAKMYSLVYVGLLFLTFGVRYALLRWRRRRNLVSVQYPDGSEVHISPGTSVLEASLMGRIPHAHLCGGRGRCSTCRVRVYEGRDRLAPPAPVEQRVLRQIGAAENIRLACQTYPRSDCRVYPICRPTRT